MTSTLITNQAKTGFDGWTIKEAFGSRSVVDRLMQEAIGMASVTGSSGSTASETGFNVETGERNVTASVTVERLVA